MSGRGSDVTRAAQAHEMTEGLAPSIGDRVRFMLLYRDAMRPLLWLRVGTDGSIYTGVLLGQPSFSLPQPYRGLYKPTQMSKAKGRSTDKAGRAEQEKVNEEVRLTAERLLEGAEAERQRAESGRRAAEAGRNSAEDLRKASEAARQAAEAARRAAEEARKAAEEAREAANEQKEIAQELLETLNEYRRLIRGEDVTG